MFTSMATRMALDLDLPKAYNDLTAIILSSGTPDIDREASLFRKTRVWFGVFVLEHMLVVFKNSYCHFISCLILANGSQIKYRLR
jgi:hypothetical protein